MRTMRAGVKEALIEGTVVPGDVEIADGVITAVGVAPAAREGIAVPGYIDVQVNGFAGIDFLNADAEEFARAGQALAATGVTGYQPTLISSPTPTVLSALERVSKAMNGDGARILGVHLEGPFLAPAWKGAHDERHLVPPDLELAARLCEAGPVTYMTIAPEQPGGFELLDWLVQHAVVVSIGHSDADASTAHAAYNRGARAVTHLHNAQRRFTSRDPGVAGVALTRSDVWVTAIVDLIHLAPETVLVAWRSARERFTLITDAIMAAGMGEGEYSLGDRTIIVGDGAARLADGTLAGSVLTMERAVRILVDLGVPWPEAVRAASMAPARLIGRDELGTLRPSTPADVTILDEGLHPRRTIVRGDEAWAT